MFLNYVCTCKYNIYLKINMDKNAGINACHRSDLKTPSIKCVVFFLQDMFTGLMYIFFHTKLRLYSTFQPRWKICRGHVVTEWPFPECPADLTSIYAGMDWTGQTTSSPLPIKNPCTFMLF